MKKRMSVILTFTALLIGFLSGKLTVASSYKRSVGRAMDITSAADASTTVVILRRLRAGDTNNAIEYLENKLDEDLLTIALLRRGMTDLMRDPLYPSIIQSLAVVKVYRTEYPHKSSNPGLDEKVAKALHF